MFARYSRGKLLDIIRQYIFESHALQHVSVLYLDGKPPCFHAAASVEVPWVADPLMATNSSLH